ncbi:MAG TPA: hypothetical protein VHJ19_03960 [Gammaproteobacteria bacterium]|nr:hypothetical protein [Gammaproteobacteria bacterium]
MMTAATARPAPRMVAEAVALVVLAEAVLPQAQMNRHRTRDHDRHFRPAALKHLAAEPLEAIHNATLDHNTASKKSACVHHR